MTTPSDYIRRVVRDDVRSIHAYPVASATGMVKLDAMENPYRLPDPVRAELARAIAAAEVNRYPDPSAPGLKAALRETMGIPAACEVLLGNGSDEIIAIATLALARPGAVVLAVEPSFVMYRMNAGFAHCRYESVSLRADFTLDVEAVLARIAETAPALVWLAYPNNPTGNLYPDADIERIIRAAPGLVVVDEAYNIFAGRSFMGRVVDFPNLMVMRTVSKIGLAGVRLGYAAAHPDWIRELDKVRPPYNVSVLAQAAGEVLLRHTAVFDDQAARIRAERAELADHLAGIRGITVFPSEANFLLVRVPDAAHTHAVLKSHRILVRNLHGAHPLLANCLRLTVGTPGENQLMLAALNEAV
jgi:histidinol-phosphate aminotransferase